MGIQAIDRGFHKAQEPYLDPRLPFYEAIVAFLADIARWERERRSERTRAGLRRAVAQGKHLGRPKGSRDSRKRVVRRHSRPQLSGRLS